MSEERVVPRELAEQEFSRWLAAMDLVDKCDTSTMDAEDVKGFEKQKRTLVQSMERGALVVDDAGLFVFTTSDQKRITFYEPTGGDLMAMDQAKSGRDVEKTNKVLAAMTKENAAVFAGMKARDYRVCQAIFVLFLA